MRPPYGGWGIINCDDNIWILFEVSAHQQAYVETTKFVLSYSKHAHLLKYITMQNTRGNVAGFIDINEIFMNARVQRNTTIACQIHSLCI